MLRCNKKTAFGPFSFEHSLQRTCRSQLVGEPMVLRNQQCRLPNKLALIKKKHSRLNWNAFP